MKNIFEILLVIYSHNFITAFNNNPLELNNNKINNTFMKT